MPIADAHHEYANALAEQLRDNGIRVELDYRNEKIGYKIREAQMQKVPYMLVLGDKEVENKQIAVRSRKEGDQGVVAVAEFIAKLKEEINSKAL